MDINIGDEIGLLTHGPSSDKYALLVKMKTFKFIKVCFDEDNTLYTVNIEDIVYFGDTPFIRQVDVEL